VRRVRDTSGERLEVFDTALSGGEQRKKRISTGWRSTALKSTRFVEKHKGAPNTSSSPSRTPHWTAQPLGPHLVGPRDSRVTKHRPPQRPINRKHYAPAPRYREQAFFVEADVRTLDKPPVLGVSQNSFCSLCLGATGPVSFTTDQSASCHPRAVDNIHAFLAGLWRKDTTGVPEISICITAFTADKVATCLHFRQYMIVGVSGSLRVMNRFSEAKDKRTPPGKVQPVAHARDGDLQRRLVAAQFFSISRRHERKIHKYQ